MKILFRQDRGRGRRRSLHIPRKLSRRHSTTSNQSGVSHRSTVSTGTQYSSMGEGLSGTALQYN